jgi:hypothetical protein
MDNGSVPLTTVKVLEALTREWGNDSIPTVSHIADLVGCSRQTVYKAALDGYVTLKRGYLYPADEDRVREKMNTTPPEQPFDFATLPPESLAIRRTLTSEDFRKGAADFTHHELRLRQDPRFQPRETICLGCRQPFLSEGAHNRICSACKTQAKYTAGF